VKEIYGIDIPSKMIAAARRQADEHHIENIHFSKSTLFDDKLYKESFDVILAIGILHLVEDVPGAIQRTNELLKPGGLFISSSPCTGENASMLEMVNRFIFFLGKSRVLPPLKFLNASELERSSTDRNFRIAEAESLPFYTEDGPPYIISRFIAAGKV